MFGLKRTRAFVVGALAGPAALWYGGAMASPPTISSVDSNGVDLINGQASTALLNISIGGTGSGLARTGIGYDAPYGDNFSGVIDADGSGNLTVSLGGSAEAFNLVSGAYQSASGSPRTLTCTSSDCTYTLSDGTVAVYNRSLISSVGIQAGYATLVSITKPDGEVITLTYRSTTVSGTTTRYLMTAASTLGWMLKYRVADDNAANYVPVKVQGINTSVDYCDPAAVVCSGMSVSWPYAEISATSSKNALGHQTTFTGGMDYPTAIVSPEGVTKAITYYTSGIYANWVQQVTIGASTWNYTYSASGNVQTTVVTDPAGGARILTFDKTASQVLSDTDPMGRTTKYAYYTSTGAGAFKGAVSQVIAPDATYSGTTLTGGYIQYTYDSRGNVTGTSRVPKGGGTAITTSATYPSSCTNIKTCNKPLTTTDEAGVTTTYTYDGNSGSVATATLPAVGGVAPQTRYTYALQTPKIKNSSGVLVNSTPVYRLTVISKCMTTSSCAGTSDEHKAIIAYAHNNVLPTSKTVARGDANLGSAPSSTNIYRTATMAYDNFGNVTSVDGPISGEADKSFFFYDALQRQTGMIGPDPDDTGSQKRPGESIVFDDDGQVLSVTAGAVSGTTASALSSMTILAKSATEYSASTGLPMVEKYYPGAASTPTSVTQIAYDSLFRTDCIALRMNSALFGSLPSSACTTGTAGVDGPDRIVKYYFNKAGQVLSSVSGYNVSPRVMVTNAYNTNGTLATVADDKGNLTSYSYDAFNRLIKVCYPNPSVVLTSSTSDCEQIAYTGDRPTTTTLRSGQTIGLAYDTIGRLSALSGTVVESYSYNNFSRITSHTANSVTETYAYDPVNGLLSNVQPMGTVGYAYDAYGRRSQLTYPASGGNTFNVTYGYQSDGSLSFQKTSYNGATALTRAQYAYETDSGLLASLTLGPSGQVVSDPSYDASFRLSSLNNNLAGTNDDAVWGFTYTTADQIKSRTQTGSANYNYVASNRSTTYGYNGLNQLTSAYSSTLTYDNRGNVSSDGVTTYGYNAYNLLTSTSDGATLTYDASNRLASISKSGVTTKFLYDGSDLIAEYDGSNNLLRRYMHGPGIDQPLVWFEGASDSTPRYLTADQQGSITAVTDASGNKIAINTYDEYGLPAPGNMGRFQYTGQAWLTDVNLYYYKARMYAPSLGRFLQPDPIGYGDGMNMYAYVGGDPINKTDPTGMVQNDGSVTIWGSRCGGMLDGTCISGDAMDWLSFATGGASGFGVGYNFHDAVEEALKEEDEEDVVVVKGKRKKQSFYWINNDTSEKDESRECTDDPELSQRLANAFVGAAVNGSLGGLIAGTATAIVCIVVTGPAVPAKIICVPATETAALVGTVAGMIYGGLKGWTGHIVFFGPPRCAPAWLA